MPVERPLHHFAPANVDISPDKSGVIPKYYDPKHESPHDGEVVTGIMKGNKKVRLVFKDGRFYHNPCPGVTVKFAVPLDVRDLVFWGREVVWTSYRKYPQIHIVDGRGHRNALL
jgi:hypothetical protein